MVRTVKKRKYNRKLYALTAAIVVLVLGVGWLLFAAKSDDQAATPTSSSQSNTGSNYSTTPLDTAQTNQQNDARKDSSNVGDTLDSPSTNPSLSVAITRVSRAPSKVFTIVNGATSGTCTLTATSPGQSTVTASSSVALNVNTYECQDFGLSSTKFASGKWNIVVKVTSAGSTASSAAWELT